MKPSLSSFASLAFLVFAGWQTYATLARTPAFNRSLQVETASGGGITRYARAMYDRAEYFYRVSLEWYYQIGAGATGDGDVSTSPEDADREAARRSRDIAHDSLRISPGDPMTWMLIAKAEAALGNREAGLKAYRISKDLAPHSASLSMNRLYFLVPFMSDPEGWDLALATISPDAVQTDLHAMREHPGFRVPVEWLSGTPAVAAFLDRNFGGD